jgi:hypothetical protein
MEKPNEFFYAQIHPMTEALCPNLHPYLCGYMQVLIHSGILPMLSFSKKSSASSMHQMIVHRSKNPPAETDAAAV